MKVTKASCVSVIGNVLSVHTQNGWETVIELKPDTSSVGEDLEERAMRIYLAIEHAVNLALADISPESINPEALILLPIHKDT